MTERAGGSPEVTDGTTRDTSCPECETGTLTFDAGPLPVCPSCDWTGWGDE